MSRLPALALALALPGTGCVSHEPSPAPVRPQLSLCLETDRPGGIESYPETIADGDGWTFRTAATVVADPVPAPCGGWESPAGLAFDDAGGYRWSVWLAVRMPDGTQAPLSLAPVSGEITFTLRVAATWARDTGLAIVNGEGLVLASNLGLIVLEGADAGGLGLEARPRDHPVYQRECGRTRDIDVVFTGSETLTLSPGDSGSIALGSSTLNVWNVEAYEWVGQVQCTDLTTWIVTLAWSPGG